MSQPDDYSAMIEIIDAYDKLLFVVNRTVVSYKTYPKILTDPEHRKLYHLLDNCLYLVLVQSDLVVGLKYLDINNAVGNRIEANYFARVVALESYEALNRYSFLVGKNIKIDSTDPKFAQAIEAVNEVGKRYNNLKKTCFKQLDEIRNKVIAHKDADSLKQTRIMLEIENKNIYSIGTQLMRLNFELLEKYNVLLGSI